MGSSRNIKKTCSLNFFHSFPYNDCTFATVLSSPHYTLFHEILPRLHRHLNFKHLPHRSPKKYSSFKGAIVLTVDEAAVLAESGEIGIVSLTDDEEATVKR